MAVTALLEGDCWTTSLPGVLVRAIRWSASGQVPGAGTSIFVFCLEIESRSFCFCNAMRKVDKSGGGARACRHVGELRLFGATTTSLRALRGQFGTKLFPKRAAATHDGIISRQTTHDTCAPRQCSESARALRRWLCACFTVGSAVFLGSCYHTLSLILILD